MMNRFVDGVSVHGRPDLEPIAKPNEITDLRSDILFHNQLVRRAGHDVLFLSRLEYLELCKKDARNNRRDLELHERVTQAEEMVRYYEINFVDPELSEAA